jgi:uncharacterized protein DUF222
MFERLHRLLTALRGASSDVDYRVLRGEDAAQLVQIFTEVERIAAAGRTLAARRVEESKVWQRDGHRTPAGWVAATMGTSLGQAIGVLETGRQLEGLPRTREAFREGRLSEAQAREVSSAATIDPRSERELLDAARTQTVKALQEECRRVRAAAISDELEAHERIRRGRYFRHWIERDGAVRFDARLTPDAGAAVIAAVDSRQERIFASALRAGRREASSAYAADALEELARSSGSDRSAGPRAMVHVLVDHAALRKGRASSGQRCEIPGVGRIPAATARALAGDAIIKAILTKGSDVQKVVHLGRTIPVRLRTALEVRDPVCVVPACDVRNNLEIDHYRIPWVDGGKTEMKNLARLCHWHHHLKTHCGYRLDGGPGGWIWQTPDDREGSNGGARPPPRGT